MWFDEDLADDFGRRVRNLLDEPLHRATFPACHLSEDSRAANRFGTTAGGTYFSVGVGAAITGRGAHLMLIDDPIKGAEVARSETVRRSLKEWYSSVARTRLQPGGAVVIIQTRWHEDELAGWLLNEHGGEGWHVLRMPAIAETDEPFRKAGAALTLSRLFILWTGFLRLDGNLRGQEHICAVHFVVGSRDLVADG